MVFRNRNRKWLAPAAIVLGLSMPLAANAGHEIDGWDVVVGATLTQAFHHSLYDRHYPARYTSGNRFTHRDWYRQHQHRRHGYRGTHHRRHRTHRADYRRDRHHDRHQDRRHDRHESDRRRDRERRH